MRVTSQGYLGTYFDRDVTMRLARVLRVLSWIVAGIYALDLIIGAGVLVLQYVRGLTAGVAITDLMQTWLYLLERPVHGVVYFAVLQTLATGVLIFMDVEDNTRGAKRG